MDNKDKVIDYVKAQADRYDGKNLQFEQDILYKIGTASDRYVSSAINCVLTDINSVLELQKLMIRLYNRKDTYLNECKKILIDMFDNYIDTAYKYTGDLIDVGAEVSAKFEQGVSEQKGNSEYDEETLRYIQEHAFELLTKHSNQKIEEVRAKLGDLFLKGKANKANVRSIIENTLGVTRSKAEEIAQTELSRAYNYGVMKRLSDYEKLTGNNVRKYWHGFKYSERTCEYCRERIGGIYDLDDDSEALPAHPRCRCVWLPIMDGWDSPVDTKLISRANMLNTGYSSDMMYTRINNRLGINYAQYMSDKAMADYLAGDRTNKVMSDMKDARDRYISDKINSWDIARDNANTHMSKEFNDQMKFWKNYVAGSMADGNTDALDRSYEAIKGVMVLPWNATQLDKWNKLLTAIESFK